MYTIELHKALGVALHRRFNTVSSEPLADSACRHTDKGLPNADNFRPKQEVVYYAP